MIIHYRQICQNAKQTVCSIRNCLVVHPRSTTILRIPLMENNYVNKISIAQLMHGIDSVMFVITHTASLYDFSCYIHGLIMILLLTPFVLCCCFTV